MVNKKNKKFNTKSKLNTQITLIKKIYLKENQQITFIEKFKKKIKEYDVVKKSWGYYATPSINKRLKKFNFRTYITKNFYNHINIMIVHKEKDKNFKKYLKIEKMKIVKEITNGYCQKK